MTEECIFCNIVQKKSPAGILFENDIVIAFLDIRPVNPGNTLIIPKVHVQSIDEIQSDEVYSELFRVGRKIHLLLKDKLTGVTGFNYLIANGKDAGQEVFHVHLHIIPRKTNDGFGYKFGPNYGKVLSQKEIKDMLELLGS